MASENLPSWRAFRLQPGLPWRPGPESAWRSGGSMRVSQEVAMRLWNVSVAAVVVATLVSGCHGNQAAVPGGGPDGGGGAPDAATVGSGGSSGGGSGGGSGGQGGALAGAMKPIGPEGGSVAEPSGTAVVIPAGGLAQTT